MHHPVHLGMVISIMITKTIDGQSIMVLNGDSQLLRPLLVLRLVLRQLVQVLHQHHPVHQVLVHRVLVQQRVRQLHYEQNYFKSIIRSTNK